jgi:hypothetical protein
LEGRQGRGRTVETLGAWFGIGTATYLPPTRHKMPTSRGPSTKWTLGFLLMYTTGTPQLNVGKSYAECTLVVPSEHRTYCLLAYRELKAS